MKIIVKISLFFLMSILCITNASAEEYTNDIFTVETIDRTEALTGDTDDYYYWLTYVYSNVASKEDDSFWKNVRKVFVDSDSEIVFQVQQEIMSGQRTIVKATKVLSIFDRNQELIGSDVSYRKKIIPERRFQNSDSIKIRASLSEVSKERASTLRLVLDELSEVPLVTSFTQGSLTVASNVIDVITGLTSGPSKHSKIGTYTIQGTKELAKTGYIAIVAKGDEIKFKELIRNPGSIPKTPNELNRVDRTKLPSFILMEIQATTSLYSPGQILSSNSPVKPLIENEIQAIANADNNKGKAEQCVELRSALNYLGPLSSLDEGYAAMAALKKANYNPERTIWHATVGCLSFSEIEQAKDAYPNFKFGTCNSKSCRVANQFINSWVFNRETGVGAKLIIWFSVLGGQVNEGSGSEATFRQELKLKQRYGNIQALSNSSYIALGAMFGTKNDKTCVYDVEVEIGLKQHAGTWKVDSVNVTETDKVFDDGNPPSRKWKGLKKCSDG